MPVRASRYRQATSHANEYLAKFYDAAQRHAALMKKNAELAESEREAQVAARRAESEMATMQRHHAERMRAEFQRFGGEPEVRRVPKGTRAWEYIIPQDDPVVTFYEPGATPKFQDCRYATERVEMREIGVRFAIGLPTHVPPEAVAIKIGQEITDAVLRTWRGQSALLREGGR